jgi:hypothetical protein
MYVLAEADTAPQPVPIVASVEHEAKAREFMVSVWRRNQEPGVPDNTYLDELTMVSDAQYMREYVWVFLRNRNASFDPGDLKLREFEAWRAEHLPHHAPQTLVLIGTHGK